MRYDSLRVSAAITAERDLELIQLDVKSAFLNGIIDSEIYIKQPEGYVVPGRETDVCRLNKSIYGICQASRIWNQTLHNALIDFGFTQSTTDPCVYSHITPSEYLIIAIWVDDGLVACSTREIIDKTIRYLNTKFSISAGLAEHFVGIVITRDRPNRKLYLSTPQYVDKFLAKFNMSTTRTVSIPILKGTPRLSKTSRSTTTSEDMSSIPYRDAVGALCTPQ